MQAQSSNHHSDIQIDDIVKKTIEEVTGHPAREISMESDLEEDLGISVVELLNIVRKIQFELQIELAPEAKEELLEVAQSVQDLVEIIEEEYVF